MEIRDDLCRVFLDRSEHYCFRNSITSTTTADIWNAAQALADDKGKVVGIYYRGAYLDCAIPKEHKP